MTQRKGDGGTKRKRRKWNRWERRGRGGGRGDHIGGGKRGRRGGDERIISELTVGKIKNKNYNRNILQSIRLLEGIAAYSIRLW